MGIESDQLVYDYLSRIGDLAQQRQLPSGTRMELVATVRGEIDRQRARATTPDTPASVRRILGRLGSPDDVVTAASSTGTSTSTSTGPAAAPSPEHRPSGGDGGGAASGSSRTEPSDAARRPGRVAWFKQGGQGGESHQGGRGGQGGESGQGAQDRPGASGDGSERSGLLALPGQRVRRRIPRPRLGKNTDRPAVPPPPAGGLPPHLAGLDELGSSDTDVDWWSMAPQSFGAGERVAGFTGGVEIPEILRPPLTEEEIAALKKAGADDDLDDDTATEEVEQESPGGLRRVLSRLRRRGAEPEPEAVAADDDGTAVPATGFDSPFLLLAAALLIGGAVFSSYIALGLGWLCAYGSRKLSDAQRKFAVFVLPGAVAMAGLIWMWSQVDEGGAAAEAEAAAKEGMREAIGGAWPWVVKGAAIASAIYLIARARRR
ncbi:hypothetical protein [Streptomyces sp. NPDC020965]|uniref:hypothetical protein n=1 Tax=Streptomyces sp. NPDC020965 TaxID=3365105 RepID=UPI00378F0B2E